ncbi:MAG: zinc-binding dehydrogenase, partial [Nitrospinaceae bacterium]|nr:zinc-binding dehydrogenase [Nitrospinaceae bacterium]
SGAKVITTVSSKEKGDVAASLGADVVVNYRDEDFASRCASETGGQGVDAVIEMVATENFDGSCRALKKGGTMVLLGSGTGKNPTGSISYPPFYSKDIDVRGMSLFNADSVFPDMLRQVNHLLEAGMVRPLLGEVIPIAEAARAHDVLMTGKVAGKIVLKI